MSSKKDEQKSPEFLSAWLKKKKKFILEGVFRKQFSDLEEATFMKHTHILNNLQMHNLAEHLLKLHCVMPSGGFTSYSPL